MDRIVWIDRMRGLAILSVVIQHLTYNFSNEFVYHKLIGISNMAVFFFVSGYILSVTTRINTIQDGLRFLYKKTIQLMLPLVVWQLLVTPYFFTDTWVPLTPKDVIDVFKEPHLWFLLTLYGYMFAFAFYVYLFKNKSGGGILYWLFVTIIVALAWKITGDFHLATLYIPYFAFGVLFASAIGNKFFEKKLIGAICVFLICLTTCFWKSGQTSVLNILIKLAVSFSMIQIIYNLTSKMEWNKRIDSFVQLCGYNSLAIYIVHWSFLHLFDTKLLLPQNEMITFGICLITAIAINYVCIFFKKFISLFPLADFVLFGTIKRSKEK